MEMVKDHKVADREEWVAREPARVESVYARNAATGYHMSRGSRAMTGIVPIVVRR